MGYQEDFIKAFNAEKNGEITKDELLSVIKNFLMKIDPGLPEYEAEQLTKIALDPSVHKVLVSSEDDMYPPDGGRVIPDGSFVGQTKEEKMEITPEVQEKLDRLYEKIDEIIPPRMSVRLKPKRAKTTVFDSKLGGVPYFPKSMEYPTVCEGEFAGKPLFFLAQLNFSKLPKIDGFPSEGILQFFAGCADDTVYGMDFDDGCKQNGFRVIYHENITDDGSLIYSESDMPDFGDGEEYLPFKGEFLLEAETAALMHLTAADYRFDKAVAMAYNGLFGGSVSGMYGGDVSGLYNVDEPLGKAVWELSECGTRMGGFPFFTQYDIREEGNRYESYDIMLFQSDSENGGENDNWDDEICWGDAGVANFFIRAEDLKKRDFSNVLYNWDCG